MDTIVGHDTDSQGVVERKRPAYDPNNLHPADEEARKYDDTSEGIDWDEIIATTQDDFLAGRFAFNSADYATHEEAMVALRAWLHGLVVEVENEIASSPACDTPS
jgi:hypothetical protein